MAARLNIATALSLIAGAAFAQGAGSTQIGGVANSASGVLSTEVGGFQNSALGDGSVVIGGGNNAAFVFGSIAGGRFNLVNSYGAVAGGVANGADVYGAIAGGFGNQAGNAGAIGGGSSNTAGAFGAVGGGASNKATGVGSVVAGGGTNTASGIGSIVSGGSSNTASGNYSAVLSGKNGVASADGAVVISDGSTTATNSTANSLLLSFANGVTLTTATVNGSFAGGGFKAANGSFGPSTVPVVELNPGVGPTFNPDHTATEFTLKLPGTSNVYILRNVTAAASIAHVRPIAPAGSQLTLMISRDSTFGVLLGDEIFVDTNPDGDLLMNGNFAMDAKDTALFVSDGNDWVELSRQTN